VVHFVLLCDVRFHLLDAIGKWLNG
jgi:hypothetical protein